MRSACERARITLAVALASALVPAGADAASSRVEEEAEGDSTYGRIDGDIALMLSAGVVVGPRAPRAALDFRARYLQTAGVFFTYEDGPIIGASPDPRRVIATGLELRPLFIGRWLTGKQSGSGRFDLILDSFGLELGAAFLQPDGAAFASRTALQAGLGIEIPFFARATGPWIGIHGGARWSNAMLGQARIDAPSDRALYLAITLGWQQLFMTHAVDFGDRAPR
jgi:hypothetical protein